MALPANSTFLPVIDDLLSPDFRPALQTPVTPADVLNRTVISENGTSKVHNVRNTGPGSEKQKVAAAKIQNWWKNNNTNSSGRGSLSDVNELKTIEATKHSIRHTRTEEHVKYLECEVQRLKTTLSTERKMRSLQLDAIRSLWGQVQKLSVHNGDGENDSIMTQSMPNGLQSSIMSKNYNAGCGNKMSASFTTGVTGDDRFTVNENAKSADHCSCSGELQMLRETFQKEIGQLRELITNLQTSKDDPIVGAPSSSPSSGNQQQPQRPATLNIAPGQRQPRQNVGEGDALVTGYASEMATKLIEGVSSVESASTDV